MTLPTSSPGLQQPRAGGATVDLEGRTALALLACGGAQETTLLLGPGSHLSAGSAAPGTMVDGGRIPFPFHDASFDTVVIDADAITLAKPVVKALQDVVSEIVRVSRAEADWIVIRRVRRIPRKLRALGEYRLRLAGPAWINALRTRCDSVQEAGALRLDGRRLTEFLPAEDGQTPDPAASSLVTILHRGKHPTVSVLERVGRTAGAWRADRLLIRKIGKTAAILTTDAGPRIVRLPLSPVAVSRAECNFSALERLHGSDLLSAGDRSLVPRALLRGVQGGQAFYVEDVLEGRASHEFTTIWEPQALAFLTRLHLATRRAVTIDEMRFGRMFEDAVRTILDVIPERREALERILSLLRQRLHGQMLPLVWSHGDFSLGNCLYDATGHLSGVVDWELFSEESLPLLDLFQCMPVHGESNSHPYWQRFQRVLQFIENESGFYDEPVLRHYASEIGIEKMHLVPLCLMYWVDHVARRIAARRHDPSWMRKRVIQPLADLDLHLKQQRVVLSHG